VDPRRESRCLRRIAGGEAWAPAPGGFLLGGRVRAWPPPPGDGNIRGRFAVFPV